MDYRRYNSLGRQRPKGRLKLILAVAVVLVVIFGAYVLFFAPTPVERAADRLQFDSSVSEAEQQTIRNAVQEQSKTYDGTVTVSVQTSVSANDESSFLSAYLPVTNAYATRQAITKAELAGTDVYIPGDTGETTRRAIASLLGTEPEKLATLESPASKIDDTAVAFIPADTLSPEVKLLAFEGAYYLDSFQRGAVFRQAVYSGDGASELEGLVLNDLGTKESTLKVNLTGVTALTRRMMTKLNEVGSAAYFSEKIGPFLAEADITHVSNEVSFKPGCEYSDAVFCSPPEMIEALKASGVNLVELTGNHNNDVGSQYNTETINQYHELGWGTFGGGINAAEAAKPFISDQKGTKVAFLGYNYPDTPGGAVATDNMAGANGYDAAKAEAAIARAKEQADFVIVNIQFWECYAYPDGYIEYPECDVPIGQQSSVFRQVAGFGADMVVGSSAHQPQTYEFYNGTPIYYGLGNLYFDQTRWPGTERGIVLTNYFSGGKLLQTKLSPTVYDADFQPRLMDSSETQYLLERLKTARAAAGL